MRLGDYAARATAEGEQLALHVGDATAEELAPPHPVEKLNAFIRE